jgi:hypothetical protein
MSPTRSPPLSLRESSGWAEPRGGFLQIDEFRAVDRSLWVEHAVDRKGNP